MIEKACSKCNQVKSLSEFSKCKTKAYGVNCWCRSCTSIHQKKYYFENPDKRTISRKKFRDKNYEKNYEKNKIKSKKFRVENSEKIKIYRENSAINLKDIYVIGLLKSIMPYEAITQELIETKRMQIKLLRLIKELKK